MPAVETPVDVIRVEYICDKCGEGKLLATYGLSNVGTSWRHECSACGDATWKDDAYPLTRYVPREAKE